VDDLLDVSRIAQGRVELRCETIVLSDVLSRAIEMAAPPILDRKHTLVSLPSPNPLYVRADPARLTQAIANLLTNSAKYTDHGGKIRTRLYAEGGNAIIEVSDNGAGIAPELLPRLFELFVQGDRASNRSRDGLGIGLALVRRLVEMHGGTVTAASPGVGAGSTFQIRLPLIAPPSDTSPTSGATTFRSRRVLIVDDDADSADSLAMLLKVAGHATEAVYAAQEALERVITFGADVVLVDIGLPDMNGYELARALRAQAGSVQLVAVTGHSHPDDIARSQAAGFAAHLVKPVSLPELERALARPRSPV